MAVGLVGVMTSQGALAQEVRASTAADLSVTMGGAGAWIVSQDLGGELLSPRCRWCDRSDGVDTLNAVDRAGRTLRWQQGSLAATLSNLALLATPVAAGATSAVAAGHGGANAFGSDALAVTETGILAADLNQLVKFLAMRERPYAHERALSDPGAKRLSVDDDLSFCSGHTTEAFALAVAAGTVSSLHGYRLAPLVWSAGLPLAAVTGYLRIAADRHYLTDVLAGAVLGAAVGFLVPYALHQPASSGGVGTTAQGYSLGISGMW